MELFDDMYAVLAIGARPVQRIICNLQFESLAMWI
jgi:hypothetical protein